MSKRNDVDVNGRGWGIGTRLYGYCNGFFDDDYGIKVIVAVGTDWIVVRNEDGRPMFTHFYNIEGKMDEMIREWMVEEGES